MKAIEFKQVTHNIAEHQDEYETLPAHISAEGVVTACFELDEEEEDQVAKDGVIYLRFHTFGKALNPIGMSCINPWPDSGNLPNDYIEGRAYRTIGVQDDCAPDSLQEFEKRMKLATGLSLSAFKEVGTRDNDDISDRWTFGAWRLSIAADDPYYRLDKFMTIEEYESYLEEAEQSLFIPAKEEWETVLIQDKEWDNPLDTFKHYFRKIVGETFPAWLSTAQVRPTNTSENWAKGNYLLVFEDKVWTLKRKVVQG